MNDQGAIAASICALRVGSRAYCSKSRAAFDWVQANWITYPWDISDAPPS